MMIARINPLTKKMSPKANVPAYVRINKYYTATVFSLDSLISYANRQNHDVDTELFALVKQSSNSRLNLDVIEYVKDWKNDR